MSSSRGHSTVPHPHRALGVGFGHVDITDTADVCTDSPLEKFKGYREVNYALHCSIYLEVNYALRR